MQILIPTTMHVITLSDGRYLSKWIGVKPLFTTDERLAKPYVYAMQAQLDVDKLVQQEYKATIK
jgi:hypothetical protein